MTEKKRILIVKTSSLGDIIHSFPVLDYLHCCYPEAIVDWVVEERFAGLVQSHPYVSSVIPIDSQRWRKEGMWRQMRSLRKQLRANYYDVLFDLQGNCKSAAVTFMTKAAHKVGFGWKTVTEWPNVLVTGQRVNPPPGKNIRDDYLHLVHRFFGDEKQHYVSEVNLLIDDQEKKGVQELIENPAVAGKMKVLVCPGSAWPNKQLPEAVLVDFLKHVQTLLNCGFLFLWGSIDEKPMAERLQQTFAAGSLVVDRLPLPALQNLMSDVGLVVAMDSLPLHLSGTTKTPSFSVFGPSLAEKYSPPGEHHHFVQGQCPYGKTFGKRCELLRTCETGSCMNDLKGEELFNEFRGWWNARGVGTVISGGFV